jgi:HEAT repeat protein
LNHVIRQIIADSMKELGDRERQVQTKGKRKLEYLGGLAFSDLVKGLESENRYVRYWCAHLLVGRGSAAVAPLSRAVRFDPDGYVRSEAASSLGQTYDPKAIPALLAALEDEDFHVLSSTIRALKYLKAKLAVEPLKKILENTEVDGQLRRAAAEALFHIDRDAGRKAIGDVLVKETNESIHNVVLESSSGNGYWPPDLLKVRQITRDAATLAGERFGSAEFDQLLKHIDSPYWAVSSGCLHALGQLNVRSAVPAIIALGPKKESAYNALAKIASPQAVTYLLEAIQSPDENICATATDALGYQGGRWAIPILIELLDDPCLRSTHKGERFSFAPFDGILPDGHKAHSALCLCLGRAGLQGTSLNLASGKKYDVDAEIKRLKVWWEKHGDDFLRGKRVPNPNITHVFLAN